MRALLDRKGHLTNDKCFILPDADPCLHAILNSKLLDVWFRLTMPCLDDPFDGGDMEFRGVFMQHTPIAPAPPPTAARLSTLADRIQSAKQTDPEADTAPMEHEIDETAYKLYGLDERDVALIEGVSRP